MNGHGIAKPSPPHRAPSGPYPSIAKDKVPLVLELLSPAQRPVQVTRDLPGFWAGSYAAVRSDVTNNRWVIRDGQRFAPEQLARVDVKQLAITHCELWRDSSSAVFMVMVGGRINTDFTGEAHGARIARRDPCLAQPDRRSGDRLQVRI